MGYSDYNFKDFKNNSISCDECQKSLGATTGEPMEGYLCNDCFNDFELIYKKNHPEEYD